MWAACQVAKNLPADKRVVCIFTDSLRNYITKFVSDDWLLENNLIEQKIYDNKYIDNPSINLYGESKTIKELDLKEVKPILFDISVAEVLEEFKKQDSDYVIKCFD